MKKNRKRIVEITMLIIVSIFTILFVSKELINKNKIPEKSINNIAKNKSLAIMVTNENGIGYKEYEGEKWPEGYSLAKSECVDNNGNKVEEAISYDESANKVTLKAKRTVYCTLYFDEDNILNTLRKNDPNEVISKELVGDLYRYQGVRTKEGIDATHKLVDNNYICFGTHNEGECKGNSDKYMYRIIGVTNNGSLKVIKMTGVEESGTNTFMWNDTYYYDTTHGEESCPNGECPEWPNTSIFKRLNGISKEEKNPNIFINNNNYSYMAEGSNWYNLIEDHNWMYGTIATKANSVINDETIYGMRNDGLTIYKIETGKLPTQDIINNDGTYEKYQWSNSVKAKVGLMYLHDYYLAYDNITTWDYWTTNGESNQNKNNWLLDGPSYEWTMVKAERFLSGWQELPNGLGIMVLKNSRGTISNFSGNRLFSARPVFYIKSGIELDGTGTESNPYIIPPQKNEQNQIYYDYEYRGDIREFVAPEDGTYKLEVWGAQGGNNSVSATTGGLGGYSVGEVELAKNDKLYVVVGGEGESYNGVGSETNRTYKGGYNGGGVGGSESYQYSYGGGGATHIAKVTGLLSSLESKKDQILIVAGGGGGNAGQSSIATGGSGGGIKGVNGINTVSPGTGYYGTGATQEKGGDDIRFVNSTALGKFGQGGNFYRDPSTNYAYVSGAGGGGGYYGGGGSSRGHAGAGGGSGYIGNGLLKNKVMYCYKCESDGNANTKTITTDKTSAEPQSNTPKQGNGFARITKIK